MRPTLYQLSQESNFYCGVRPRKTYLKFSHARLKDQLLMGRDDGGGFDGCIGEGATGSGSRREGVARKE